MSTARARILAYLTTEFGAGRLLRGGLDLLDEAGELLQTRGARSRPLRRSRCPRRPKCG